MSEHTGANDPGTVWRDQPEEEHPVNLEQILSRRSEGLHASTRSEILTSIGAAALLAGISAWRLAPAHDRLLEIGLGAVIVWVAVTVVVFRRRMAPGDPPQPDRAASGAEYYRRELERRRDHLRNEWLWHGPLLLACIMLGATLLGRSSAGFDRLQNALPLLILLVVWAGYGYRRRRLQASELQREIDEMDSHRNGG